LTSPAGLGERAAMFHRLRASGGPVMALVAAAALAGLATPAALALKKEGAGKGGAGAAAHPAEAAAMAEAANRFLAALTPEQRKLAEHPFEAADRESLKFVPMVRSGVPLKKLTPDQRKLALAMWRTGLGQAGQLKVTQIMELEPVLAALENNPVRRDPDLYYFWVFGKPTAGGTWGWKAEGHHLSFNFTVVKGQTVATTPTFMGANPAEVREGPLKGRRVLRAEEELARELARSFAGGAPGKVVFDDEAPPDILTSDHSRAEPPPLVGVEAAAMKPGQRELLRKLLAEYAAAMPAALAQERLARIDRAGFDKLRFGWAGSLERGQGHYYRIQGPTFLLEYDNTQSNANHVHTAWRDFNGDYGRDLLREHRAQAH
jgi:hypothetical protein